MLDFGTKNSKSEKTFSNNQTNQQEKKAPEKQHAMTNKRKRLVSLTEST